MKKLLFALSAILMITLASCGGKSNENANVNIDDYVGKYKVTDVSGDVPKGLLGAEIIVAKIAESEDIEVTIDGQKEAAKKEENGTYKLNVGGETIIITFEETSDGKIIKCDVKTDSGESGGLTAKKVD